MSEPRKKLGPEARGFRRRWLMGSLEEKAGWPEFVDFYNEWFKPFVRNVTFDVPYDMDERSKYQSLLAMFFGLDHRTIDVYEAKESFVLSDNIPYKWPHEVVTKPGETLRKVAEGNFLFLRVDNRVPRFHIELQVVTGGGVILGNEDERRIFLLTTEAFGEIRPHLKLVESN